MKAYIVTYDGLWMGGRSVVIARSKKVALRLVREDPTTLEFNEINISDPIELDKPKVLWNENGNY